MPTSTQASSEPAGRTFTRHARQQQIIDVTVRLLAEHGHAGVSLSQIATGAGVSKPTVLYYFADKAAVVQAAHDHVLQSMVAEVGEAVDAATTTERPAAYVRSMLRHFSDHPHHARASIEALTHSEEERDTAARWRPLADLLRAAREARGARGGDGPDERTAALIVGGAIDAIIVERLRDPDYASDAAAEDLVQLVERHLL